MATYNPFKKPIGQQLDVNDLNVLITNQVAEGFHVEYKSDFVRPDKIARSIASFANTYGGWYFIGVEADKPKGGVASNICGFDITNHQDPMNKALTPVRQNLSHMPLLYHQLIEIGQNRAVIAIYVPEGLDTPYIAKDGVIYRRAADASDPILEADRHSIDQIVERGRNEKKRFADFCRDGRSFGKDQANVSWINVYLQPQPRGFIQVNNLTTFENIEQLIAKTNRNLDFKVNDLTAFNANVPFNAGQSSGLSVLLKQMQPGFIAYNGLTIQLFPDGSCKIHIPIPEIELPSYQFRSEYDKPFPQMTSDNALNILKTLLESENRSVKLLKFLDFSQSTIILAWAIGFYLDWFKENDLEGQSSIWVKVDVQNIWRAVPVGDSDYWANIVNKFGLPVSQNISLSIPSDKENYLDIDNEHLDSLWTTLPVLVGNCLGLPHNTMVTMFIDDIFRRAAAQESSAIQ